MIARLGAFAHSTLAAWLGVGVCASAALLGILAYSAAREWQHSARIIAEHHTQQGADLLALALRRDMRGVQVSVLSSQDWNDAMAAGPAGASRSLASTFARFPYPEVFFWWDPSQPDSAPFFTRSDRIPAWLRVLEREDAFPVLLGTAPDVARRMTSRIARDVAQRRAYSIFDLQIGNQTYQVVSRLRYQDPLAQHLQVIGGFMVNLEWARQHYLTDIARQVTTLAGADSALAFTVIRETGEPSPRNRAATRTPSITGRQILSMAFFDPILIAADPPTDLALEEWTISSTALDDKAVRAASVGALRVLIAAPITVIVFSLGMAMSLRAARAHSRLAQLRADFVSTVTHELKTPVATIRAAGDTLAEGRITSSGGSREYAEIVVEEAKTLTRLLDNLLAYSRVTDTKCAYAFRPIPIGGIVDDVLRNSRSRLDKEGFAMSVNVPEGLALIRADRTSLFLAMENLVDNAIRYSRERRWISITACSMHDAIRIDVADRGIGIPPEEIEHVTTKFYRGSGSGTGGSGLGLALAQRIIVDHAGSLVIQSSIGVGTTVSVTLPIAQEGGHEETSPRHRRQPAPFEGAERQPEI